MKIGMLGKFGESEGIAIYADSLTESLREKINVVTIGDKESISDYNIDLKSAMLKREIQKIIEKEKLNILHVQYIAERNYYGLRTLNLNLIHALNQKIPTIATMHEIHYTAQNIQEWIVKKLEEAVIKRATAAIVHTNGQKKFVQEKYGKKAELIYHGLTPYKMHKKKGKNILFFGILSEAKGTEYLIDAMNYLDGYNLKIAGKAISQKYADKLLTHIKKCRNKAIKIELGWVSEEKKREYFENSDITILPYLKAQFQSGILHNAMSYGLPVVATKTGAIWEIVKEFNCGTVIEPGNSREIAKGTLQAYERYEEYQKGIIKYRKEANWKTTAEKHIKLYSRLI